MAFNLKKNAEAEKNQETQLKDNREKYDLEPPKDGIEAELGKNRKKKTIKDTYEGLLDDARTAKDFNETIEAQLDNHEVPAELPARNGDDSHDQLPINLLGEVRDKERARAFEAATVKDADTDFWDKLTGADDTGDSQLHNHPDRFKRLTDKDVLKNKNVRQMVTASLKDADAMLYHIYHTASSEIRPLTKDEQKLVDGITADKTKLASMLSE